MKHEARVFEIVHKILFYIVPAFLDALPENPFYFNTKLAYKRNVRGAFANKFS